MYGVLVFVKDKVKDYFVEFNILVVLCISFWGYEIINCWNLNVMDLNCLFYVDSLVEEFVVIM